MAQTSNGISGKGVLLSLAIIPITVILWVVVWRMGFIASLVSFVTAYGAIWLYKLGSRGAMTKAAAAILVVIMLVSVGLAFLGGMASDGYDVYKDEVDASAGIFDAGFVDFYVSNLSNGELWSSYTNDILMSLVFVVLGAGWAVKDLFVPPTKEKAKATK